MIAGAHAVLWVRRDPPGNDACRFAEAEGGYLIDGSSTDADWNMIRYRIRARQDGTTRRARIGQTSRIFVTRSNDGDWTLNGVAVIAVKGAKDVELDFSPSSMTLPIRRLKLAVGEAAEVLVAHLDSARGQLTPRRRTYRRTALKTYEQVDGDTGNSIHVKVDAQGIVRECDGIWIAQA